MSGGLLDAVERAAPIQLDAAEAGYRWLGLDAAADVIAMLRREIENATLDDDHLANALELRADEEYNRAVPTDQTIFSAFHAKFVADPGAFAPV
ncbi:hypothetical protein [Rudaeicoccus suwonensis]|nr:hypothetical protein [Rudaeicoccus suwonensis]